MKRAISLVASQGFVIPWSIGDGVLVSLEGKPAVAYRVIYVDFMRVSLEVV